MKKIYLTHIFLIFLLTLTSVALIVPVQGCAQTDSQTGIQGSASPKAVQHQTAQQANANASNFASEALYQPEIHIAAPTEVLNGQAFLIKVSSARLERIKFPWAGKQMEVNAMPAPSGGFEAIAMLGVDLDSKPEMRKLNLSIVDNGKEIEKSLDILVSKKKYPQQELSVEPRFVQLSEADLKRSQKERVRSSAVLASLTPVRHWQLPFARPVPGTVSSLFGVARVFNGEPRSAHKGLDLRGATGTPIAACADGTVKLAENMFFAGNVVYLDHGLGVFTMYCHMSEIKVKEGDFVRAGELLGLVGATGRVTGPHLHLSAYVMGIGIDPEILFKMNMDGGLANASDVAPVNLSSNQDTSMSQAGK